MNHTRGASVPSERHALVLGAGMAGLLAARVLTEHFDHVTIVESDELPDTPEQRIGVPQGRHLHVLLERGRSILETLFPGLTAELTAAGAPSVNQARDLAWLTPDGWGVRYSSKIDAPSCSRALLEWTVRRRVVANCRVRVIPGFAATGLLASRDQKRVLGARICARHSATAGEDESEIQADLVVDATGRGSHATDWLRNLGYERPKESTINAFLGYASRVYRPPADFNHDWKALYIQLAPPTICRGGVIYPIENGLWMAAIIGAGKDYPPTDEEDFLSFARSLRSPLLYEVLRRAEPVGPIVGTRSSVNVYRHFETLARWPEGFIVTGDAACAFNPVYGQGMSVAAMDALVLDGCLRESLNGKRGTRLTGMSRTFQKRLAKSNGPIWTIATGEDVRVPGVEGGRPGRIAQLTHRYVEGVVRLSTRDPFARQVLIDVLSLTQPMTYLFHPRLILGVLRDSRTRAPIGELSGPEQPRSEEDNVRTLEPVSSEAKEAQSQDEELQVRAA